MRTLTSSLLAAITTAALMFAAEPVRFDDKVRNNFFAGLRGDAEAMARGMADTEAVLAQTPNHAEALVWHGVGLFTQSGQAFRKGDQATGMSMFGKAMAEMDRAVELEPNNFGVRIPRGSALMAAARSMEGNPMTGSMFERALTDYLRAFELQRDSLDQMGTHPRGELLFGIADTYARQGNTEKADEFFNLLAEKSKDTPYAKRAAQWKETRKPLPAAQTNCIGCHVK
jgi:tetratricopeptide (TPR) repeat protein